MPQVIFIMTDTQRKDMVAAMRIRACGPTLDRLASRACASSRVHLPTRVRPGRRPVHRHLPPPQRRLGQLARAGRQYPDARPALRITASAAYIGKWHLDGSDYFGLGHAAPGWDPACWYDMRNYLEELTPEGRVASARPRSTATPTSPPISPTAAAVPTVPSATWNSTPATFLLVLSYDEPHHPSSAPALLRCTATTGSRSGPTSGTRWPTSLRTTGPGPARRWTATAMRSRSCTGLLRLQQLRG